jgi:hypothetical protein
MAMELKEGFKLRFLCTHAFLVQVRLSFGNSVPYMYAHRERQVPSREASQSARQLVLMRFSNGSPQGGDRPTEQVH